MYLTVLAIFLLLFVVCMCGGIAFVDFIYEYQRAHKALKGLDEWIKRRLGD